MRNPQPARLIISLVVGALACCAQAGEIEDIAARLEQRLVALGDHATKAASSQALAVVLSGPGEALDPMQPFQLLDQLSEGRFELLLAASDGTLVAWSGARRRPPRSSSLLGERRTWVELDSKELWLLAREPVLESGKMLGSVVARQRFALGQASLLGVRALPSQVFRMARDDQAPAQAVSFGARTSDLAIWTEPGGSADQRSVMAWIALGLAALFLAARRAVGVPLVLALAVMLAGIVGVNIGPAAFGLASMMAALALHRSLEQRPTLARISVITGLLAIVGLGWAAPHTLITAWMPGNSLQPGWGAAMIVATAILVSAWPGLRHRLVIATLATLACLAADVARVPAKLSAAAATLDSDFELAAALDVPAADDPATLAWRLASRLELDRASRPYRLELLDGEALVASWGDLPTEATIEEIASWPIVSNGRALEVVLLAASGPWRYLADWRADRPLEAASEDRIWWAVFDRAGRITASLHADIEPMDLEIASALAGRGQGWTRVQAGLRQSPARVWRRGDDLIAAIIRRPAPAFWLLEAVLALLWSLAASCIVLPPTGIDQRSFSGRLRVLVAVAILAPLFLLSLFVHQRLLLEERHLERQAGRDAIGAARWTIEHLASDVAIDDDLARSLADQVGVVVQLFNGTELIATSRRDLVEVADLPQLPDPNALPAYLAGREELVIEVEDDRLEVSTPVQVGEFRLLLGLISTDPRRQVDLPSVTDWLLAGSVLAAIAALVLVTRFESRLTGSLAAVISLARRAREGSALGEVELPPERDLAEVVATVHDMAAAVAAREALLRRSEERTRIVLETLQAAVFVIDADGQRRSTNAAGRRLEDDWHETLEESIDEAIRKLGKAESDTRLIHPRAGVGPTWSLGLARVPLPDGPGVVVVVDDVSEALQTERLRQLTELARIVAHEVKNPLTPIRLWMQELERAAEGEHGTLAELTQEAAGEIAIQVARLHQTASSFSNLVALESWDGDCVDLAQVVDEALVGLGVLGRRGIDCRFSKPSQPALVRGDRAWLRRAVGNLIDNSLKVTKSWIHIDLEVVDNEALLTIADDGAGVPPQLLGELFRPHFSTTSGGSGLGLSLVQTVIQRCGGQVVAENGDAGLVVRIRLPRMRIATGDDASTSPV